MYMCIFLHQDIFCAHLNCFYILFEMDNNPTSIVPVLVLRTIPVGSWYGVDGNIMCR